MWNCNIIYKKFDLLKLQISKSKPNIIGLSKIKLNKTEANELLFKEGYDCVFKLRNSKGGGSALFINNEVQRCVIAAII
jgi:hypothetical protein